jgi:hypothetical protein
LIAAGEFFAVVLQAVAAKATARHADLKKLGNELFKSPCGFLLAS